MEAKYTPEEPRVEKILQTEPVNTNIEKVKGKNSPGYSFPFASVNCCAVLCSAFEDNKKVLKKGKFKVIIKHCWCNMCICVEQAESSRLKSSIMTCFQHLTCCYLPDWHSNSGAMTTCRHKPLQIVTLTFPLRQWDFHFFHSWEK